MCDDVKLVQKDVEIIQRNPSLFNTPKKEKLKYEAIKNLTEEYSRSMTTIEFVEWLDTIVREARKKYGSLSKAREKKDSREVSTIVVNLTTSRSLQLPTPGTIATIIPDPAQGENSFLKCSVCGKILKGVSKFKIHMKIHTRSSTFL